MNGVIINRPMTRGYARHMIPDNLDGWTLDKIREVATLGVTENDLFDLKADLQPAEAQRKTVASFANSEGGFLVFGVTNDRRVVGVTNGELVRDFGSKLREGLTPSVDYRFRDAPHTLPDGRLVYVAHVFKSVRGPHAVYANGAWAFVKRTTAGTSDPLSYEEIRDHFSGATKRKGELAWLHSQVKRIHDVAYDLNVRQHHQGWNLDMLLTRFDAAELRPLLVSLFLVLDKPPSLIAGLQLVIHRCQAIDAILAPAAAWAMEPRFVSSAGPRVDVFREVRENLAQIGMETGRVLPLLAARVE